MEIRGSEMICAEMKKYLHLEGWVLLKSSGEASASLLEFSNKLSLPGCQPALVLMELIFSWARREIKDNLSSVDKDQEKELGRIEATGIGWVLFTWSHQRRCLWGSDICADTWGCEEMRRASPGVWGIVRPVWLEGSTGKSGDKVKEARSSHATGILGRGKDSGFEKRKEAVEMLIIQWDMPYRKTLGNCYVGEREELRCLLGLGLRSLPFISKSHIFGSHTSQVWVRII